MQQEIISGEFNRLSPIFLRNKYNGEFHLVLNLESLNKIHPIYTF